MGLLIRRFFLWLRPAGPILFDIVGFVFISIGAGMIYYPAGWLAAGGGMILIGLRLES